MKKNKDIEEAEFIKAIGKCIFQVLVPFDVVSSRFVSLFSSIVTMQTRYKR
jgi:hypothetical protein